MIPKFKTAKEREAKEKKTKRFFGILVIAVLSLSVAAFALMSYSPPQTGEKYGKFTFTREIEGWQTQVNDYFLLTTYLPQEVESINHSGIFILEDFQNVVYFVAKSESERKAANELDKVLLALKKEIACLPKDFNESACMNMSVKSCGDASFIQKIVVFEENDDINKTSIEYKNNCLTIKGDSVNIIRAIDKVIFLLFGIIK